jgi:large subunit ribosomal protein L17
LDDNAPRVKGRIVTTLPKAKEVRPLVEKCITIARYSLKHEEAARELDPGAERGSDEWRAWRQSERWRQWAAAIAPAVAARRRALQLLGDKQAVRVLFDEVAPRFADRPGGYTRILKLATPRLGDAGPQAILEFVGVHDRVSYAAERPAFDVDQEGAPSSEAPQQAVTEPGSPPGSADEDRAVAQESGQIPEPDPGDESSRAN